MSKTVVNKRIGRKIQPKQFESLEVAVEYQDEIEWTTKADRQAKLDELTNEAVVDFKRSFDKIKEDLGLEDKPVSVTQKLEDGTVRHGVVAPPANAPVVDTKKSLAPTKADLDDFFDGV